MEADSQCSDGPGNVPDDVTAALAFFTGWFFNHSVASRAVDVAGIKLSPCLLDVVEMVEEGVAAPLRLAWLEFNLLLVLYFCEDRSVSKSSNLVYPTLRAVAVAQALEGGILCHLKHSHTINSIWLV